MNEFELKIKGADYLEILATGGGIINRPCSQTREASLEDLVRQCRARLDKMLAHGTATARNQNGLRLGYRNRIENARGDRRT